MTRVGFLFAGSPADWLGGTNYFRNLLGALMSVKDRQLEPVVFVSRAHAEAWREHVPGISMIPTSLVDRPAPSWIVRKGVQAVTGRDLAFELVLRRRGVRLYSHGRTLGRGSRIRTLGWIQDCQHMHLPEFFTAEERRRRDESFRNICRECDAVVVSSEDARKSLVDFEPAAATKVQVLHFVPDVPPAASLPTQATLEERYGFQGPYLHLPNQFWKHKNHQVVVDALRILRDRGTKALVLSTGGTRDYRNPDFFASLMAGVEREKLGDSFRPLGVVPYKDMLGLMFHSHAVINPSLFEGWSTTVEEAKRLGLPVLLSDIAVHREQAPEGGVYFASGDPAALAEAMATALGAGKAGRRAVTMDAFHAFGEAYQRMVLNLLRSSA